MGSEVGQELGRVSNAEDKDKEYPLVEANRDNRNQASDLSQPGEVQHLMIWHLFKV